MQKEVLTPIKGENFIFPIEDATVQISGGYQRPKPSTLIRDLQRGEEQEVLRGESDGTLFSKHYFKKTQRGMTRKLKMTAGL